jgi:hypothetical protein
VINHLKIKFSSIFQLTILGQLEAILSQRCYEVYPYVCLISSDFVPKINYSEVEQILFMPVKSFLAPHSLLLQPVKFGVIFTQIFFQVDVGDVEQIPKVKTSDRLCYVVFGMTGNENSSFEIHNFRSVGFASYATYF